MSNGPNDQARTQPVKRQRAPFLRGARVKMKHSEITGVITWLGLDPTGWRAVVRWDGTELLVLFSCDLLRSAEERT